MKLATGKPDNKWLPIWHTNCGFGGRRTQRALLILLLQRQHAGSCANPHGEPLLPVERAIRMQFCFLFGSSFLCGACIILRLHNHYSSLLLPVFYINKSQKQQQQQEKKKKNSRERLWLHKTARSSRSFGREIPTALCSDAKR